MSVFAVGSGSTLVPGGEPISAGTAVLSETAAEDLDAGPGDPVSVNGEDLTVTAVRGDDSFGHTPVVWTTLTEPAATVIALTTADGFDGAATDRLVGTKTVSKGDSLSAIGSYSSENGSLQLMRGFLFVIFRARHRCVLHRVDRSAQRRYRSAESFGSSHVLPAA